MRSIERLRKIPSFTKEDGKDRENAISKCRSPFSNFFFRRFFKLVHLLKCAGWTDPETRERRKVKKKTKRKRKNYRCLITSFRHWLYSWIRSFEVNVVKCACKGIVWFYFFTSTRFNAVLVHPLFRYWLVRPHFTKYLFVIWYAFLIGDAAIIAF